MGNEITTEMQERIDTSVIGQISSLTPLNEFWQGVALGFQEDTDDTATDCYAAEEAMFTLVNTSNFDFLEYAEAIMNKGKTASDFGYMVQLYSMYQDFQLVGLNVFNGCNVDLLLIQLGKISRSTGAATNVLTTIGFEIYQYYFGDETTQQETSMYQLEQVFAQTSDDETENAALALQKGKKLATFLGTLLQYEIPTFVVDAYGAQG